MAARSGKVAAMLDRFRALTSSGLREAAGLLPAERLRAVQVMRFVLRTLADAIEPLLATPPPATSPPSPPAPSATTAGPACGSAMADAPVQIQLGRPRANGAVARAAATGFQKVGRVAELAPGCATVVQVGERAIALFNVDGTFHALDNRCLHRGGSIGEGKLEGAIIECPLHGWQYDVTTGQCQSNPAKLESFKVKVEGDEVLVEI